MFMHYMFVQFSTTSLLNIYSLNGLLILKYSTGVANEAEKEMLKNGCAASLSWSGVLFCLP